MDYENQTNKHVYTVPWPIAHIDCLMLEFYVWIKLQLADTEFQLDNRI